MSRTVPLTLVQAGWAGLATVIVSRGLGPDVFGRYTLAVTSSGIAALVLALGTGVALRSLIRLDVRLLSYLILSLLLAVVAGVANALIANVTWQAPGLAASTGILAAATLFGRQALDAMHALGRTHSAISLSALGSALLCLSSFALATAGVLTLSTALFVTCLSVLTPASGLVVHRRQLVDEFVATKPRDHARGIGDLVRVGMPALGMTVGLAILMRVDRLILGFVAGAQVVAQYAVATSLAEVARIGPTAVGQVAFFRAPSSDPERLRRLRRQGVLAAVAVGGAVAVSCPFVIPALFGSQYKSAVPVCQVLSLAEVAFAFTFIDGRVLLAHGRTRLVGSIGAACALIGTAAYYLGSAFGGAVGTAAGAVVGYSIMSLATGVALRREMKRRASRSIP